MMTLFPEIKPYRQHRLAVEHPHELYIEESGKPDGIPVLFVHGGPGSGCTSKSRCFFSPEHYRIILFDQRGAGQSTPYAELDKNNSQSLIEDIDAIREHLGIEQWVLFGGSWGSTLSLLYAQAYPNRVLGLILRGIFLCREQDIQWFYHYGASQVFPDYWSDFNRPIDKDKRDNLLAAYYQLLTSDNELERMSAAKAWCLWEGRCATLRPNHEVIENFSEPHTVLAMARIEAHYFMNKCFLEPNQLLDNMRLLTDIPGIIVHGRYDMVCTLDNAVALHEAWPGSQLNIIRDAGHASTEPSITDALVLAARDMVRRLRPEGFDGDASD